MKRIMNNFFSISILCASMALVGILCQGIAFADETMYAVSISGIITAESDGLPISGAKVMVRRGEKQGTGGMNITWEQLDKMNTGTDGAYSFSGLEESVNDSDLYQVLVYHDTYNTKKSANLVLTQDLVLDFALSEKTYGGIKVFVGKAADNSPLEGAMVAAGLQVNQGALYTGRTGADGWITFPDAVSGTYRITACLTGYDVTSGSGGVESGKVDTVRLMMPEATSDGKTLEGTVVDEDGDPVPDVVAVIKFGGLTDKVIMVDSVDDNGHFTITGIPDTYADGKVEVETEIYKSIDTIVVLGNEVTEVTIILILKENTVIQNQADAGEYNLSETIALVRRAGNRVLQFNDFVDPAEVAVYSLAGQLLVHGYISPKNTRLKIPVTYSKQCVVLFLRRGRQTKSFKILM